MLNETINTTFNFSSYDNYVKSIEMYIKNDTVESCFKDGGYKVECLYKSLCTQFNAHIINTGLFLIISYIAFNWLSWWFLDYGYKKFNLNWDLEKRNRIYWWIKDRYLLAFLGYTIMVVYLALYKGI